MGGAVGGPVVIGGPVVRTIGEWELGDEGTLNGKPPCSTDPKPSWMPGVFARIGPQCNTCEKASLSVPESASSEEQLTASMW